MARLLGSLKAGSRQDQNHIPPATLSASPMAPYSAPALNNPKATSNHSSPTYSCLGSAQARVGSSCCSRASSPGASSSALVGWGASLGTRASSGPSRVAKTPAVPPAAPAAGPAILTGEGVVEALRL